MSPREPRIRRLVRNRNLTRRGRRYRNADGFVVSIPKSGRTWLRVFLRHYLCNRAGVDFRLTGPLTDVPGGTPRLEFSHDLWEHLHAARRWDRLRGKYLIPTSARERACVVLVVRDLRDLMVSLHLHLDKRGFACGAGFDGSLPALIRHPRLGVESCVDLLNAWYQEWHDSGRLFVWRYEDCHDNPRAVFADVLRFLGLPVDADRLDESVAFAGFDSMRALERSGDFWESAVLRPGDPEDPQSFKVRRGIVGGYVDHLTPSDLDVIARAERRLLLKTVPGGHQTRHRRRADRVTPARRPAGSPA